MVENKKLLAAVDIGSNSIHLIVARVSQGALQTMQSYRERVQLAAGLGADGILDAAAFERGLDCLRRMGQILADHNPDQVRVVATHTLRVAKNRNDFIRQAERALGYRVEVIAGAEEARVIFQGVAHSMTLDSDVLVIDIGGGSTELAVGRGFEPRFTASCAVGCVSFRDRFFAEGCDAKAFAVARNAAMRALEAHLPRLEKLDWQHTLATSGTAKALERVVTYLAGDDEAQAAGLDRQALYRARDLLIADGLAALEPAQLGSDRLPLIPGGLAIMIALVESLDIETIQYRDVALREGVLYELDDEMRQPDIVSRTRHSLHQRYQVDTQQAARVADSCQWLLEHAVELADRQRIDGYIPLLLEAAELHEVGLQISASGLQRHSRYILENSDLPGFAAEQQLILAHLVGRYRKRPQFDELPAFTHLGHEEFRLLALILRLAAILNVPRKPVDYAALDLKITPELVNCRIAPAFLAANPLLDIDLQREKRYLEVAGIDLHLDESIS